MASARAFYALLPRDTNYAQEVKSMNAVRRFRRFLYCYINSEVGMESKRIYKTLALSMVCAMAMYTPALAARMEQWLPERLSEGLVTMPVERKVGYADKNGKTVIEPTFDAARPFSEGLAAVRVKGKWGFIDHSGKFVIEPKFDAVGVLDYPGDDPIDFSEGCAAVRINQRVGFINKQGKFVVPARYASAGEFRDGLAAVQDGKWGFIDKQGRYVIKPQFRQARSFSEGLAAVERGAGQGWGYIDKSGNFVVPPQYALALSFHEQLALVLQLNNGVYYGKYIDRNGKPISTANFHGGNAFADGLAPVPLENHKFGYIDKSGKTVITPEFDEARSFSEGVAVVKIDADTWGLIDKSGEVLFSRSTRLEP